MQLYAVTGPLFSYQRSSGQHNPAPGWEGTTYPVTTTRTLQRATGELTTTLQARNRTARPGWPDRNNYAPDLQTAQLGMPYLGCRKPTTSHQIMAKKISKKYFGVGHFQIGAIRTRARTLRSRVVEIPAHTIACERGDPHACASAPARSRTYAPRPAPQRVRRAPDSRARDSYARISSALDRSRNKERDPA